MTTQVPYPGYTWSITQHFGRATSENVYALLQAAYLFGRQENYSTKINQYLAQNNVLTQNVRSDSGVSDAWRDYQQILNELGLIVSTKFTDGVVITPTGLALLDGMFGYSELVTTQCFKYQYPNGYKQDIQATQRAALAQRGLQIPSSRTELDSINGVSIKPGILILRIILELLKNGHEPQVYDRECVAFLFSIKTNQDWMLASSNLINGRNGTQIDVDGRLLRHAKEWFSFLDLTDIFTVENQRRIIKLSNTALENLELIEELCAYHEDEQTFWYPSSSDKVAMGISWFNHYGALDIAGQWLTPELSDTYVNMNYPAGIEDEEPIRFGDLSSKQPSFALQPYTPMIPQFRQSTTEPNLQKYVQSKLRYQQSARLHEEIVARLARRLTSLGYSLSEDRSSVDLLAEKNDEAAILEVKTITRKNLNNRLRLGVGQLSEYRYRHQLQTMKRPIGILVLGGNLKLANWIISYFDEDIKLGLISAVNKDEFLVHTQGNFERIFET